MKHTGKVLLIAVICLFPVAATAGKDMPWEKKLPFETATITYAIHGMEEGEEVVYLRDYGRERATYHTTVSKMMGMTMQNSSVDFQTPDAIYSFDLQEKSGSKSVNPQKYMVEEYEKLSSADKKKVEKNAEKLGGAFSEGMSGAVQQNVLTILGYSCDKVSIMSGSEVYLIHDTDIPLKSVVSIMGMSMVMEATSIDTGKVDDKYFQHPAGIVVENDPEADGMARTMARQTIAMLKDPEAAKEMVPAQMGIPQEKMDQMSEEEKQMMQQMMEGMKGLMNQ